MKKLLFFALTLTILLSCSNKRNYNKISVMNSSYPIELIYFDSESENELGEFPISRAIYADLIEIVENQNPR